MFSTIESQSERVDPKTRTEKTDFPLDPDPHLRRANIVFQLHSPRIIIAANKRKSCEGTVTFTDPANIIQ